MDGGKELSREEAKANFNHASSGVSSSNRNGRILLLPASADSPSVVIQVRFGDWTIDRIGWKNFIPAGSQSPSVPRRKITDPYGSTAHQQMHVCHSRYARSE